MKILQVSMIPGFDGSHNRVINEVCGLRGLGMSVEVLAYRKVLDKVGGGINTAEVMSGVASVSVKDYDIVHVHDVYGLNWFSEQVKQAGGLSPRLVVGVHFNSGYFGSPFPLTGLSDAVVCVSEHNAAELKAANPDIADKIRCIYTGIDPSLYGKGTRDSVVIGMYGSGTRKGQDVFEAVARELTQYRFEIAGARGTDTDNLKYLGRLEPEAFRAWLAGLSVYVQPSRAEALGTSLLEAGASYCACIGSDVGGIPEVILPGVTGVLVTAGDIGSLVNAVGNLAGNEKLQKSYGAAIRTHVCAKFTADQMVDKTAALYRGIAQ